MEAIEDVDVDVDVAGALKIRGFFVPCPVRMPLRAT